MSNPRRIAFRFDAGGEVGLGHLTRCMSLAGAAEKRGWSWNAACPSDPSISIALSAPGSLVLPWKPSFEVLDAQRERGVGEWAKGADWIVVDHYGADRRYLQGLRRAATGSRLLLIEDHQHRIGADLRVAPLQRPQPGTLSGTDFILLRPEFTQEPVTAEGKRGIVVFFGGGDPKGLTKEFLAGLSVTGIQAPSLTILADDALARRHGLDGTLASLPAGSTRRSAIDAHGMAQLLRQARLAVCSASTIALEALAVGTPVVALEWIGNQAQVAAFLRDAGMPVATSIAELLVHFERALRHEGMVPTTIDAHGADRLMAELEGRVGLRTSA